MTASPASAPAPGSSAPASGGSAPATRVIGDLRLVARQVRYEQLTFWLNPIAAVFTIGFSVVFLILLGASAGSSRISFLGNIKLIQYYVPGFVAYGVMSACFTTLTMTLVNRREMGLLKRLRLSPLPAWALLGAVFFSTLIVAFVQVIVLLLVGRLAFGVHLPGNIGAFVLALVVGALSFTALGAAMSTLVPNQDAAGPVTSIVFFILLFLSGLWFPIKSGSGLAKFSTWFPIRHFIQAVFAPFNLEHGASPWAWHDLLVVAIWGVIGAVVAVRRFDWAPRRK
jgi:ABC-2 type transport system permease protein